VNLWLTVLDHENEEQFLKLFESFRAYAEPENIVDYHLVFTATVWPFQGAIAPPGAA
jgi:hypothetical protein